MASKYKSNYVSIPANATTTVEIVSGKGAKGDLLASVIVNVTTAATGTVGLKDGSDTAITLVPANTPIGVYNLNFGPEGVRSRTGAWQLVVGAGANALAVGNFF